MGGSSSLTNGTVLMWEKIHEWKEVFTRGDVIFLSFGPMS